MSSTLLGQRRAVPRFSLQPIDPAIVGDTDAPLAVLQKVAQCAAVPGRRSPMRHVCKAWDAAVKLTDVVVTIEVRMGLSSGRHEDKGPSKGLRCA